MCVNRHKQIEDDEYYMHLATAVESGANCLSRKVGAVLVFKNRVIGTGYNGTPAGFKNCNDGGCVRCRDSKLHKEGRVHEMSDREHESGKALDRCICVHAEQNAFITAARFGIHVEGATLYTTQSPCFGCLKEAIQAGIVRIVYRSWYPAKYSDPLKKQYEDLCNHLANFDPINFEPLGGSQPPYEDEGQPDPFEDEWSTTSPLEPPNVGR